MSGNGQSAVDAWAISDGKQAEARAVVQSVGNPPPASRETFRGTFDRPEVATGPSAPEQARWVSMETDTVSRYPGPTTWGPSQRRVRYYAENPKKGGVGKKKSARVLAKSPQGKPSEIEE